MDALKDLIADLVEQIKKLTAAILSRFEPSSPKPSTPLPVEPQTPPVEPPVKPETPIEVRNPMDPRSVLGIPMNGPDGSAHPTELFRGDPSHPKYRPGDGRKILLVSDALMEGKPWDYYLLKAGEVWDLEVTPDHPSIGFKIPK